MPPKMPQYAKKYAICALLETNMDAYVTSFFVRTTPHIMSCEIYVMLSGIFGAVENQTKIITRLS